METKAEMLFRKCKQQNEEFRKWDGQRQYLKFHLNHYDWWAFPVDRRSGYGNQFKVFPEHRLQLIANQQFIQALRSNSILVCRSWGYNLQEGKPYTNLEKNQQWQDWSIRLYKMTNSLDLFKNAVEYGVSLIDKGDDFTYGPKDMKPYFRLNYTRLFKKEDKQKEILPPYSKEGKDVIELSTQIENHLIQTATGLNTCSKKEKLQAELFPTHTKQEKQNENQPVQIGENSIQKTENKMEQTMLASNEHATTKDEEIKINNQDCSNLSQQRQL